MKVAIITRLLFTSWLVTAWLALSSPIHASHLEGATGLDFQREVNSGSSGGFSSSGSFGGFGSFGTPHINCNRPGETAANCGLGSGADPDKTPFLQELVSDGGKTYYHMIIGLPGEAFVQETFISTGGSSYSGVDSASGGQTSCQCSWGNHQGMAGSGWDPLRNNAQSFTGIASGDPTQNLIRQIISSPGMSQEFLKDKFALKPKITQDINTSEVDVHFVVNMNNSNYSTNSVAGTVLSTLTFVDPQAVSGNFNSATPGATPGAHVTAGRYTYVMGSGSGGYGGGYGSGSSGFGGGSSSSTPIYTYVEGANSFNPNNVDWQAFRDASQNFGLPKAGNSGKTISGGGGFGGF